MEDDETLLTMDLVHLLHLSTPRTLWRPISIGPRASLAGLRAIPRRRRTIFAALAATLASVVATTSAAIAQNSLEAPLAREMRLAGPESGAYVYDLTKGTTLFSEHAEVPHPPASVEKLYTGTTALELMGAEATLTTSVLATGHPGPAGRWEGNLYLKGGGDPTFGSAELHRRPLRRPGGDRDEAGGAREGRRHQGSHG